MFYAFVFIFQIQFLFYQLPSHYNIRLIVEPATIRSLPNDPPLSNQNIEKFENLPPPPLDSLTALAAENKFQENFSLKNNLKRLSTAAYYRITARAAALRKYDYIVVGGGVVGCPLARTLAESGKTVLLIERGGSRSQHPETLDIYGAGEK